MADTRGLGALQMAVAHRHNSSLQPKSLAKDNPDETLEDKLSRMHKVGAYAYMHSDSAYPFHVTAIAGPPSVETELAQACVQTLHGKQILL